MTLILPRFQSSAQLVDSNGYPTVAFHIWWDTLAKNLESNFNNLSNTVQALVDLNDDNTLTPAKKPVWIMLYSNITAEQADIDAQATSYGITTEKTNYDNAVTALVNYLATLTTPVAWNDLTGNTTIVGTTFRTDFNTVFSTKQILLDKMHGTARTLANTAQSTATSAQGTANTAVTNAATAQSTANTATTNAATAQSTANTAVTNAASAQSTADTVKRDDKITASAVIPANVLSAADAGSDVTITIAAHSRRYGDTASLSITGGTLTGAAYSTTYGIYYDDTSTSNTSPTYHKTTTLSNALNSYVAGRHFLGTITTPAAAGAATTGGYTPSGTGASDTPTRSNYNV